MGGRTNRAVGLFLGLMLVFEPKEPDLMRRPPRATSSPIVTSALLLRTIVVAALILAGDFGLFVWQQSRGTPVEEARTAVVNLIVLVEAGYLFACRSLTRSFWELGLLTNPLLLEGVAITLAVQAIITYWRPANRLFESAPIGWGSWLAAFAMALLVFIAIESEKGVRRRLKRLQGLSDLG